MNNMNISNNNIDNLIEKLSNLQINENEYELTNDMISFVNNEFYDDYSIENKIKYFKYLLIIEKVNKQILIDNNKIINEFLFYLLSMNSLSYEQIIFFIDFYINNFKLISNDIFELFAKISNFSNDDIEFRVIEYFIKKSLENNLRDNLIINLKNFLLEQMVEWIYDDENILLIYMDIFYSLDKTLLLDINNEILTILENNFYESEKMNIFINYYYKYDELLNSRPIINNILKNIIEKLFIHQNPFLLESYVLSITKNLYEKFGINFFEELKNNYIIQNMNNYCNYFKYVMIYYINFNINNIENLILLENLKNENELYPIRNLKQIINKNFNLNETIFKKLNINYINIIPKYNDYDNYIITIKDLC
jgi:hypothetical protein